MEVEDQANHVWLMLRCRIRYVIGQNPVGSTKSQWLHGVGFRELGGEGHRFVNCFVAETDETPH